MSMQSFRSAFYSIRLITIGFTTSRRVVVFEVEDHSRRPRDPRRYANRPMLTYREARDMIDSAVRAIDLPDVDIAEVVDEHTLEKSWGWVFFYQSRSYRLTGEIGCCLAGNAPYIVNRFTGDVRVTGTAHAIEHYIEAYEVELEDAEERWALHVNADPTVLTLSRLRRALDLSIDVIGDYRDLLPGVIATGARKNLLPLCDAIRSSGVDASVIANPNVA